MAARINRVSYYYITVRDAPGEAYKVLSSLAAEEVNLLAFHAIPMGGNSTQLALFAKNESALTGAAQRLGLGLTGPEHAFLVQGDDELGALVNIHGALFEANINVYASSGVTDGRGSFGYTLSVKAEDFEDAARTLGLSEERQIDAQM